MRVHEILSMTEINYIHESLLFIKKNKIKEIAWMRFNSYVQMEF